MRRVWLPTTDEILEAHDRILARFGGESGVLHLGALEAAVERARWGPFERAGDAFERASLILRGIALDHPFVDGNKRTAFEAADTLLSKNGIRVGATPDEVIGFMLSVTTGAASPEAIAAWLRGHSTSAED